MINESVQINRAALANSGRKSSERVGLASKSSKIARAALLAAVPCTSLFTFIREAQGRDRGVQPITQSRGFAPLSKPRDLHKAARRADEELSFKATGSSPEELRRSDGEEHF